MSWKGPTNASNSVAILSGLALLSAPSIYPYLIILLTYIFSIKIFQPFGKLTWERYKECRFFTWIEFFKILSQSLTGSVRLDINLSWVESCFLNSVLDAHDFQLLLNGGVFLYSQIHNTLIKILSMINMINIKILW